MQHGFVFQEQFAQEFELIPVRSCEKITIVPKSRPLLKGFPKIFSPLLEAEWFL